MKFAVATIIAASVVVDGVSCGRNSQENGQDAGNEIDPANSDESGQDAGGEDEYLWDDAAKTSGTLVFKSGFEVPEIIALGPGEMPQEVPEQGFVDTETGYVWGLPWLDVGGKTYVRGTYLAGSFQVPYQIVDLIEDPDTENNHVLYTSNVSDVVPPMNYAARVALRIFPDNDNPRTNEFYCRYRVRLDPALALANELDSWSWFNILEVKEEQKPPFFFTGVSLWKDVGGPILWGIKGRHKTDPDAEFTTIWEKRNPDVPIPLGRWFTLEYYIKRHTSEGRILLAIELDSERSVIFDLDQRRPETLPDSFTTMEPSSPYQPLEAWEIMKTYVGPPRDVRLILGEPLDAWYDDLEIWTGIPPQLR